MINTKIIFDEATDVDVYALKELAPELSGVVEALLEHINDGIGRPVCGAIVFEPELLVEAALASDCTACRTIRSIDPALPQRIVPDGEPQPMEGADTMLAEKQKRDEGR